MRPIGEYRIENYKGKFQLYFDNDLISVRDTMTKVVADKQTHERWMKTVSKKYGRLNRTEKGYIITIVVSVSVLLWVIFEVIKSFL